MKGCTLAWLLLGLSSVASLSGKCLAADRLPIGPAELDSVLASGAGQPPSHVARFELDRLPVTNGEFLLFVRQHPQWQRGRVPALFADDDYLSHWVSAEELGNVAQPDQPVTRVSWFAARAYCAASGGRLPDWQEWELAAAANEHLADARKDPAWRARILDWYSQPANKPLARVGLGPADTHGIQDLHGLVWEWVEDFNSLIVSGDSRDQGDPDKLKFCGAGALSLQGRDNFAILMRIAFLSSLEARSSARSLGFRCAAGPARTDLDDMPGKQALPAAGVLPGGSLYLLDSRLEPAGSAPVRFGSLRGKPVLVAMFYSQCASVCPLLTSQLQHLVAALAPADRQRLQVLMVSFDSVRDSPQALSAFKVEHHIPDSNWLVVHASRADARALAAALGIKYRELPDHSFNHAAVITLLDAEGVPRARTQMITGQDPAFIAAVRAQLDAGTLKAIETAP